MKIENQTTFRDLENACLLINDAEEKIWELRSYIIAESITPENASKKLAEILEPLQIEK
jgi:hypothetical protein